ncbi:SseB family protein [Spirillospora sp. NPDC052242]
MATVADAWRPTSELERRLHESVRAGDQEGYFRVLADSELVLPVPPDVVDDVLANTAQPTWPTQEEDGRVHVLTYTSAAAMRACLGPSYRHFMTLRFGDIAQSWPDAAWWLAVDVPGHGVDAALPIEARLPSWFVRQVAEGDGRPPRVGRPGTPAEGPWEELRGQHRDLPRDARRPEFQPANDVERELLRAAANNDHDLFLQTLAGTEVLLPVPEDTDYSLRPGRPGFPWQTRDVDGATVVPVFTSPERLIEAARAAGTGTEYIRLPFTVALRYWPHPDWQLAINSGSPAGGTVQAQQLPGLATWADQRAAQRMTEGFEPQNEIEQRLFDAARRRDTDAFYKILLGAQVLVPADPDTPWGTAPDDPAFPWQPVNVHGRTAIQVFTSPKWMNDALSSSRFVMPTLRDMVAAWPDTAWAFVLNPGTPIDASMPGDQVRALAGRTVPEEPATPPSAATPPPPDAPAVPVAPPVPAAPEPSGDPSQTATDPLESLGTRVAPEPDAHLHAHTPPVPDGPGTAWPQHDPAAPVPSAPTGAPANPPGDPIGWPQHEPSATTGPEPAQPHGLPAPAPQDEPSPAPAPEGPEPAQTNGLTGQATGPQDEVPPAPTTEPPAPAQPHELPGQAPQHGTGTPTSGTDHAHPYDISGQPAPAVQPAAPAALSRPDRADGTEFAQPHGIPGVPTDVDRPEHAQTGSVGDRDFTYPGQATGAQGEPSPAAPTEAPAPAQPHELPAQPTPEALGNPPLGSSEPHDGPGATPEVSEHARPHELPGHPIATDQPAAPEAPSQPTETTGDADHARPYGLPGQATGTDQPSTPEGLGQSGPTATGAAATADGTEHAQPQEMPGQPAPDALGNPPLGSGEPQDGPGATPEGSEHARPHELPGHPVATDQPVAPEAPSQPTETPGGPKHARPHGLPGHATGTEQTAAPDPLNPSSPTATGTEHAQPHEMPGQPTSDALSNTPQGSGEPQDGPGATPEGSEHARPHELPGHPVATDQPAAPEAPGETPEATGDAEHARPYGLPGYATGTDRTAAPETLNPSDLGATGTEPGTAADGAEHARPHGLPGDATATDQPSAPEGFGPAAQATGGAEPTPATTGLPGYATGTEQTAAPEPLNPSDPAATGSEPGTATDGTEHAPPHELPGQAAGTDQTAAPEGFAQATGGTEPAPAATGDTEHARPQGLPGPATGIEQTAAPETLNPSGPTATATEHAQPHGLPSQAADSDQTAAPEGFSPAAQATDGTESGPVATGDTEHARPHGLPGQPTGTDQPSAPEGFGGAEHAQPHGLPGQPAPGGQAAAPETQAGAGVGGRGLRAVPDAEQGFEPGNRIDQELYDATLAGDSDAFLRILLNANVLVPIPEDAPLEVTPIQRDFRWDAALRDDAAVRVFTSLVRLREILPEARFVYADFRELIGAWPNADWAMLLNPGTRIGASLRGEQVRALSEWAIRVGLIQARPEAPPPREPQPEPRPEPEARPAALPRPVADPDDRVSQLAIMQKVVPHGHVGWYLEQGYDRVGGFVHLTSDVAELQTPVQLYEALGLLYDDSPFTPGDEGVYVIRWPAYCPDVYRVPFGGATEAEMAAWGEAGWVVERAPFVGTGFAPGSAGSIREFKVDSIRLPYGAEMYYLTPDRSERFVAMYDPDRLGWLRPEAGAEGWDGRTEAAQ